MPVFGGFGLTSRVSVPDQTMQRALDGTGNAVDNLIRSLNQAITVTGSNVAFNGTLASSVGFKQSIGPFYVRATSGTGPTAFLIPSGTDAYSFVPAFSGSIIGMGMSAASATAVTATVRPQQNGVAYGPSLSGTAGAGGATYTATYSKGTYALKVGQTYQMQWALSASSSSFVITSWMVVEMGA